MSAPKPKEGKGYRELRRQLREMTRRRDDLAEELRMSRLDLELRVKRLEQALAIAVQAMVPRSAGSDAAKKMSEIIRAARTGKQVQIVFTFAQPEQATVAFEVAPTPEAEAAP